MHTCYILLKLNKDWLRNGRSLDKGTAWILTHSQIDRRWCWCYFPMHRLLCALRSTNTSNFSASFSTSSTGQWEEFNAWEGNKTSCKLFFCGNFLVWQKSFRCMPTLPMRPQGAAALGLPPPSVLPATEGAQCVILPQPQILTKLFQQHAPAQHTYSSAMHRRGRSRSSSPPRFTHHHVRNSSATPDFAKKFQ